jgi:eukaryotic-like serine/threonine-protein kinase
MSRDALKAGVLGLHRRPIDSQTNSCSAMFAAAVRSEGSDEVSPIESTAAASPAEVTRSSDSLPPGAAEPVASDLRFARAPFRDPNRYDILGEHGRGALGRVSRAFDRDLRRDVAIKELISRGPVGEARFLREALITARLEHPGIVPVHEAGRWPDGTPFYAMKLVSGRSLRELIAERPTVEERIGLLHHVIAVTDAIAYAHGRSIIHRDLKPSNIIVGEFGETVVIDWGLAKDLTGTEESTTRDVDSIADCVPFVRNHELTVAGSVVGTPAYMAPEQRRGERVDQRADVFAIGAMLWELCALQGTPPESTQQRHRMLRAAGIDSDLAAIIDTALESDPTRRYSDAGALATDLKAFKSGARIGARSYSLFAMLAHWTSRHRRLALSVTSAIALGAIGIGLYVRDIAAERDRADLALRDAEAQRNAADIERDRAQLSEAAMLLEKDPSRARELLLAMTASSPQRTLLLSRAEIGAASRVLQLGNRVTAMQGGGSPLAVAIGTSSGELRILDLDTDTLSVRDRDLMGPLTYFDDRWCYSRNSNNTLITIPNCSLIAERGILRKRNSKLRAAGSILYAMESTGELYRLDTAHAIRIGEQIRSMTGSDRLSMTCHRNGVLQIVLDGQRVTASTCAQNESSWPMAAKGEHYVALRSPGELITDRGVIKLPSWIEGAYEVALGDDGLIAVGDFNSGGTWLVRPGSLRAEPAARRAAQTLSVAASGSFVGFGYVDGAVVVVDTTHDQRWELIGHGAAVTHVVIDASRRRVISSANDELRIWNLPPPAISTGGTLPCRLFNITHTNDTGVFAIDCSDGRARLWSPATGQLRELHQHRDIAYGITALRSDVCTGGWDGRVLCTPVSGGKPREILAAVDRVRELIACGDRLLFAAIGDGKIWRLDGTPRALYAHGVSPYGLAVDAACTRVASGAYDGSLIVYDLVADRIAFQVPHAHAGQITSLVFEGSDVATAGTDGYVKRWRPAGRDPKLIDVTHHAGPVAKLSAVAGGWVASIGEKTFTMHSTEDARELRLALGHAITDIAVSPDERYVAIAGLDEIIVIDRRRHALATARHTASSLVCIRFTALTTLAACDTASILTLSLDRLSFVPLHTSERSKP